MKNMAVFFKNRVSISIRKQKCKVLISFVAVLAHLLHFLIKRCSLIVSDMIWSIRIGIEVRMSPIARLVHCRYSVLVHTLLKIIKGAPKLSIKYHTRSVDLRISFTEITKLFLFTKHIGILIANRNVPEQRQCPGYEHYQINFEMAVLQENKQCL
jgi:hypothetical protein